MSEGDKPSPAQKSAPRPVTHKSAAVKPAHKPVAHTPAASKPTAPAPPMRRPAGTQRPTDRPLLSRTATLDDPLTTSLLAEVARRSRTIEVSPEQIDQAVDLEPGDRDPDDST